MRKILKTQLHNDNCLNVAYMYIGLTQCNILITFLCSVVVDSLLIGTLIVGFCNCSMFCCELICVHSSFAIITIGKRELVASQSFSYLVNCLSFWLLMIVVWLFLSMTWVCLQFVIVEFPEHIHLLFLVLD